MVEDITKLKIKNINLEKVDFVGVYCVIIKYKNKHNKIKSTIIEKLHSETQVMVLGTGTTISGYFPTSDINISAVETSGSVRISNF
jgi:hypothetical protein